ncbi:heparan sulfate glucosamine 3-O-sulfotransferase 3B1-like [Mya arenaria]|uniref:heparan sulfate glucosamine 3-O-sulfotransferase 3B1-like n=1 Tax=Mya arenaria TaxID=6604 RepID=UPI0022E3C0BA|nr:heparan sulfate glucosamine 3-O-sulfotransferase 3B1-like [Mya arenaria]
MAEWQTTYRIAWFWVCLFGIFALVSLKFCLDIDYKAYNTPTFMTERLLERDIPAHVGASLELKNYENVKDGKCLKRLPKAIIVGAMKCGTGTMNEFLNCHPDIRSLTGENDFFINDTLYNKGLTWFKNIMPCTYPHQIAITKKPQYFVRERAPPRILSMDRNIKLIFMLRDPVERAMSNYLHRLHAGKVAGKEFLQMVFLPDGRTVKETNEYIHISSYVDHVQRWLKYFDKTNMIFIDADLLRIRPWIELKRVEKFLGVRDYFTEDMFPFVEERGERCVKQMSGDFKCMSEKKGRSHPKIEEESEKLLRNYFAPLNRQLFELLNTTFDWE